MQLLIIERSTIPAEWFTSRNRDETNMDCHEFKDMQREMDVMEEGGVWSKSSSLSTVNLRDQPIIIYKKENEFEFHHSNNSNRKKHKEQSFIRLFTSFNFFSLIYQIIIISSIIGALEVLKKKAFIFYNWLNILTITA